MLICACAFLCIEIRESYAKSGLLICFDVCQYHMYILCKNPTHITHETSKFMQRVLTALSKVNRGAFKYAFSKMLEKRVCAFQINVCTAQIIFTYTKVVAQQLCVRILISAEFLEVKMLKLMISSFLSLRYVRICDPQKMSILISFLLR